MFFALANLGLRSSFLHARNRYLGGLKRTFRIQGCLGQPLKLTSTNGMPQGCCVSVVGMVVAGWVYSSTVDLECHRALPEEAVHTFVFLDNLQALIRSAQAAAKVEAVT